MKRLAIIILNNNNIYFYFDYVDCIYGPGVDSASYRNEYQEYFLGGKCGRCVRVTTLPPYCAVVTKSRNLNFLKSSGPLQACNGTALPYVNYIDRSFTNTMKYIKSKVILRVF
jgi:hypothetical protein